MKVERIDHVAIMVKDLKEAERFFSELFETNFTFLGETSELDIKNSIGSLGIELVEPLLSNGEMAKALQARGEGFLLLSLKVTKLDEAMAEMKSKGIRLVLERHSENMSIAVYHPKDAFGVMIELIEYETKHPMATALGR